MKTSYDLAMEKFGTPIQKLSKAQKASIAETDNKYKAKLAEAELAKDSKVAKANGDIQVLNQIMEDYVVEIASINSRKERAKKLIREEQ